MNTNRQLLMVIGQGRSGTSVLAGVLRELGYYVPQPEIQADETNPRGFGEPEWLVKFNRRLLRQTAIQANDARPAAWAEAAEACLDPEHLRTARTWLDEQFNHSDFVLLKVPTLVWFSSMWNAVALDLDAESTYVTTVRTPSEVLASKHHWYDLKVSETNGVAGWINTMLYMERSTRNSDRGFIEFSNLLTDWVTAVSDLDIQANLPPVRTALTAQYRRADALVDPSLQRTAAGWEDLDVPPLVSSLADRVFAKFLELSNKSESSPRLDQDFDELRAEYREMYQMMEAVAESSAIKAQREGVKKGRRIERRKIAAHSRNDEAPQPANTKRTEEPSGLGRVIPKGVQQSIAKLLQGNRQEATR